jgi:hypothetical protein
MREDELFPRHHNRHRVRAAGSLGETTKRGGKEGKG